MMITSSGRSLGFAALAAAALVWGCQSSSGPAPAASNNEHPTARTSGSSRPEHPTGPSRPSDHPTGTSARSEHPTSRTSAPRSTPSASSSSTAPSSGTGGTSGTSRSPAGADPACLLPPDAQLDAVEGLKVGQVMPAFESSDVRTGKTIRTADFRGRYLLIHYWASW